MLHNDIQLAVETNKVLHLTERIRELEAETKALRKIVYEVAAWLAFESHNVDIDILDQLERMRIKAIKTRAAIDAAMGDTKQRETGL